MSNGTIGAYPDVGPLKGLLDRIELYSQLKHEYGSALVQPALRRLEREMRRALARLRRLPPNVRLAEREPNGLAAIRALRPAGPRRIWREFNGREYARRLEGALLGRMAGCTLGAPVEGWPIERMEALARANGERFPPTDYWSRAPALERDRKRYGVSPLAAYAREGMDGVPVDDDIVYTLIGLLIVERYGPDFTTADVGKAWLRYLPHACTAERVALDNLKKGVAAARAAALDNPYCEWIGADIRADPWAYVAPGWPERAAAMAYRDAYLSHRRQGIYGEMFFAAAISAAFAVEDPIEAIRIGLTEIPRHCALANAVRWALRLAPRIRDYRQARAAVDSRFRGMSHLHTINNACLTVWGLTIGGADFTKTIGQTVAMGLDNDCTAATAGSLLGAIVGRRGIPRRWYAPFHDTVRSYLVGLPRFSITDIERRFARQASRVHGRWR